MKFVQPLPPKTVMSCGLALLGASIVASAHAQSTFGGIGFTSFMNGLSPDGDALTGVYYPSDTAPNTTAFAWTSNSGLINLGLLPGSSLVPYDSYTNGVAITNNATVVVGYGRTSWAMNEQAFVWTPQNGYQLLPNPAGAYTTSAQAVSADGSKIFGYSFSITPFFHYDGAAWTSSGATLLPSQGYPNWVNDTSTDGSVSVGRSATAAYWDSTGVHSISGWDADAVSADGKYLVGTTTGYPGSQAFRYDIATGTYDFLPYLNSGDTYAIATDISADGKTIVGYSGDEAFIWDDVHGMQSLQSVLESLGLNDAGWSLYSNDVLKISDDGHTIAGNGVHDNHNEIFIAQLNGPNGTPVPEASTYGIIAVAMLGVIGFRRTRRRVTSPAKDL